MRKTTEFSYNHNKTRLNFRFYNTNNKRRYFLLDQVDNKLLSCNNQEFEEEFSTGTSLKLTDEFTCYHNEKRINYIGQNTNNLKIDFMLEQVDNKLMVWFGFILEQT